MSKIGGKVGYDARGYAVRHIVAAMGDAREGKPESAAQHLNYARNFATAHARTLKSQGQHEEAIRFMDAFGNHENAVRAMLAPKTEKIEKAEVMRLGQVRALPNYDYKMVHELHPEDQLRAQRFFGHRDVGRYKYPVDKGSGRIIHGQRIPISAKEGPGDPSGYFQEIPAHLREGAAVRINAPGTKFHNRLGVVSHQVAHEQGKTAVHLGTPNSSPLHFSNEMLQPSRPMTRVEKAVVTLNNIRKVFMK